MIPSLVLTLALAPMTAQAAAIPKANYDLQLEQYSIQTEDYRFPSGLRILFQADHTQPIVSVTNWFDRGSLYDGTNAAGESTEGVAHAVEHLAFRAKHDGTLKNWDIINQLGGILNASTSREWTNYMTVAPVDATLPLLRLEALRLADGVEGVTAEDVEAEKSIVRNELRMGYEMGSNGSPAIRTALKHIPKLLFPPDHPYQNSTIGDHDTIANIDLETVQRFVRENYRPEFSTIAVIGDFTLEGGQGMAMIFDSFVGVEHLLMAPEDAAAYQAITDPAQKQTWLVETWIPKLRAFMEKNMVEPAKPRVDCDNRAEPPPLHSDELVRIKGMVDNPTAVVAWSMPGGYCDDDPQKNIVANLLTSYILRTLDPEYDPLSQESEIEGIGCFADIDRQATILMCAIEKGKLGKYDAERLVSKAADALYLQWAPIEPVVKPFYDSAFTEAQMSAMSDILGQTDNVASLWGRATFLSQHAHYTGSAAFFSDSIESYNSIQLEPARQLARKYITRERMASMIIEPMDEEDREQLEAGASEADKENTVASDHRAKDDTGRQLFATESLTPEAIKAVAVVPDPARMRILNLENGLEVVLMNHGETPLVKVGLQVAGTDKEAPFYGLDSLANALYRTGVETSTDPTTNPLAVAGWAGYFNDNRLYATGSAGNIDALLYKIRWHLEDYDWMMADKAQQITSWAKEEKGDGEKPEYWADRFRLERVFPGSPFGEWLSWTEYDAMRAWGLDQIKDWVFTKWQPANARLVIVGKMADMDAVEAMVHSYFDGWKYKGSGQPGEVPMVPAPAAQPDRQVLLLDKPTATQSKVVLSCQLKSEGDQDDARAHVLGEIFTFLAFERLREERGLTYGAYAVPRLYRGDTSELMMATVIQNSGAAFGVQTLLNLVHEGATGEIDEGLIVTNKWNVARTMVSSQQSGDQMLATLLGPGRHNNDYYTRYVDALSQVNATEIADALSTCSGHEVVTIVGPVSVLQPQFDQAGLAYELVDWEALHESQLTPKEQKAWRKAKAKKAEEDAKKAEEEAKTAAGTTASAG